jgi:hypothetical protein
MKGIVETNHRPNSVHVNTTRVGKYHLIKQ